MFVVTNQTVKTVVELLKQQYEPFEMKIIYSKAKSVDGVQQRHGIIKFKAKRKELPRDKETP